MPRRNAMLPTAVSMDSRLSSSDFRVLVAIAACVDRVTQANHIRRDTLADLTGIPPNRVSVATRRLVNFGYLEKAGAGGRSRSAYYRLNGAQKCTGLSSKKGAQKCTGKPVNGAQKCTGHIKRNNTLLRNAADAAPREIIFSVGLKILTDTGNSEQSARSFLGKHAKADETKLAEIIGHLAANPKIEPRAYIAAAMKPKERRFVL